MGGRTSAAREPASVRPPSRRPPPRAAPASQFIRQRRRAYLGSYDEEGGLCLMEPPGGELENRLDDQLGDRLDARLDERLDDDLRASAAMRRSAAELAPGPEQDSSPPAARSASEDSPRAPMSTLLLTMTSGEPTRMTNPVRRVRKHPQRTMLTAGARDLMLQPAIMRRQMAKRCPDTRLRRRSGRRREAGRRRAGRSFRAETVGRPQGEAPRLPSFSPRRGRRHRTLRRAARARCPAGRRRAGHAGLSADLRGLVRRCGRSHPPRPATMCSRPPARRSSSSR